MALAPGTKVGPYEILAPLGAGGMGEVWKARDTRLDRVVAIKTVHGTFSDRFEREARAISALNHPHICALHDIGEHDGEGYLVLEYVEGSPLKGPLPLEQALRYAVQICDALDAAHRKGIVHRDLKPDNILVTKAGVKLLDFGLAKALEPAATGHGNSPSAIRRDTDGSVTKALTGAHVVLGTPQYMAPEQIEGRDADARTDLFAFGCVLYELLTGRKAFEGKTPSSTMAAILATEPRPMKELQPVTPASVERVVTRCLAKDPDDRWQTARDLRSELEWIAAGGAQPAIGSRPVRGRLGTREALSWGLLAAAAVALGVMAWRSRQSQPADAIVRFQVLPPESGRRGAFLPFTISPDGQMLAFEGRREDGLRRIWIRRLDAPEAQVLAGTDGGMQPFWSPDSRSLAFFKDSALHRTALDGGAPRRLCDAPGASGGSWSTRGVILFGSTSNGVFRVPDTGGTPTEVTRLIPAEQESAHRWPFFLADGRHFLFLASISAAPGGAIWAASIDDTARTRIVDSGGGAAFVGGWLLYTNSGPAQELLARRLDPARFALDGEPQLVRDGVISKNINGVNGFSVSANGVLAVDRPPPVIHQLTWMDRTGRTVGTIGPALEIASFALAPDESRVVAQVRDLIARSSNLWLFDARRDTGTRLTYQGGGRPLWDPDGRHVYFRNRGEARTLTIGGTEETRAEAGAATVEDVTRDGRFLILTDFSTRRIRLQRVGDAGNRRDVLEDQFTPIQPRVSPDGRWLAFTLSGLPQGFEVFAQPLDRPGQRIPVSSKGGSGPIWRDDGRELYYEGPEGLMAVAISVDRGELEAGKPQRLFALHTQGVVVNQPHNVEVAAHGQKFLVNTVLGGGDNVPIEVTVNWPRLLKP